MKPNQQVFSKYLIYTLTLFLCACSSLVTHKNQGPLPANIQKLDHWTVKGKVSIKTTQENVSGYFFWQKNKQTTHFSLNSFIGTNILTLDTEHKLSTLKIDDKVYQDKSPNHLILKTTGLYLPIESLESWIKGKLTGVETNVTRTGNKLKQFTYINGNRKWIVKFSDHQAYNIYKLPKSISLTSQNTKIKLSISEWVF